MQFNSTSILSTTLLFLSALPLASSFLFIHGAISGLVEAINIPFARIEIEDSNANTPPIIIQRRAVRGGEVYEHGAPVSAIEECREQNLAYPAHDGVVVNIVSGQPQKAGDIRLTNINEGCMDLAREYMGYKDKTGPFECGPGCLDYADLPEHVVDEFFQVVRTHWVGKHKVPAWL